ncbi:MAG: GIY-YIG nuclease family protein [Candidatus Aenigmarchaeota archaeon]|nr:GIY-YIG nuclease family protein [Candidatus Aenigmarchaeota archaeon]
MFKVYILRNSQNKLYIGHTNNVEFRERKHKYGVAAKFTAQNKNDFQLVHSEEFTSRAEAMKRERQLKSWSRAKKEALIANDLELLRKL